MTYLELSRELGFGDDFEGFLVWADLYEDGTAKVTATDEVDEETATFLRAAKESSDKHAIES